MMENIKVMNSDWELSVLTGLVGAVGMGQMHRLKLRKEINPRAKTLDTRLFEGSGE